MKKILILGLMGSSLLFAGGNKGIVPNSTPTLTWDAAQGSNGTEEDINRDNNGTEEDINRDNNGTAIVENSSRFMTITGIDLRGFTYQDTHQCKDLMLSGLFEIKNKNLDYDKNSVFFRHGRITYVIPSELNENQKDCVYVKTELNDIKNIDSLIADLNS